MIYYAVRQKSTGKYLPWVRRAAWTWTEPVDPVVAPPRLHKRRGDAIQVMQYYVQGRWEGKTLRYTEDGPVHEFYPVLASKDNQVKRDPDDYEVVELELTPRLVGL